MTRVTSFGRKRTYLEAGFAQDGPQAGASESGEPRVELQLSGSNMTGQADPNVPITAPPKKKRKRTPMSKRDNYVPPNSIADIKGTGEEGHDGAAGGLSAEGVEKGPTKALAGGKAAKKNKKNKERRQKALSDSEARRLKRIQQKQVETTCFACREKGHAARDCPTAAKSGGDESGQVSSVVGICYRCGSKKHSLSRCRKPVNAADPYPFASCFVCNGKGHLASACPQNKAKGVYPNGGCCKLCGDTSHLAKDCGIRQKVADPTIMLGTGREAGPDEDDFHTYKRRTTELDRDEKQENKMKELLQLKAGVQSGVVRAFGDLPSTTKKKVVVFK
ncbi:hypothetical protein B0H34DRAFT_667709 [Crassisporium funariophilum]|nr:hypothetical protein B0H34DRAFT_667709 [Crassisporium funariophilum]